MNTAIPHRSADVGLPEGRWGTPVGITVVSSVLLVVLVAGTGIVGARINPEDDANYVVTALAAAIAALNVLFTLWLLRTAQRQLGLMRDQSIEQREDFKSQIDQLKESHDAERSEASQQLDSLREQLTLAQASHTAERDEAVKSLKVSEATADEALMTRLDQSAPRVSLSVSRYELTLKKRESDGTVATVVEIPDLSEIDGVAGYWMLLTFTFSLKNWGEEPAMVAVTSPWEKYRNDLLFPGDPWTLEHTFHIPSHDIRRIAENGITRSDQERQWAFPVVVSDLGGNVSDHHVWRTQPRPFKADNYRLILNPDFELGYLNFASRERHYNVLDRRDIAAGKTIDGPRP